MANHSNETVFRQKLSGRPTFFQQVHPDSRTTELCYCIHPPSFPPSPPSYYSLTRTGRVIPAEQRRAEQPIHPTFSVDQFTSKSRGICPRPPGAAACTRHLLLRQPILVRPPPDPISFTRVKGREGGARQPPPFPGLTNYSGVPPSRRMKRERGRKEDIT